MPRNSQRPMKIVFVNRFFDPDQSATSQMLTDLARGLSARHFDVHVVCSRQLYTDRAARLPPLEERCGVRVHRVATTRFGRAGLIGRSLDYGSFYLSAAAALLRILSARDVVVAKTDPPLISIVAALIAPMRGARLVNWQQDVFPEVASQLGANPLPRLIDSLLRRVRDWSMRRATANVVIGRRMYEYFRTRGIPESKLHVIENWADGTAIAAKDIGASALRARLGWSGCFVVCYSGNLGRAHEFDTLLSAAEVLRADPSIVFLMIGGGAKMEPLREAVAAKALPSFHFLPYQAREDVDDSLAAGDVHLVSLLPALEGLIVPSKLYGILAAGRPVVFVGDTDGEVARVIRDAACGVAVDIGRGAELAAALRELQSEPGRRAALGSKARACFDARFSLPHAIERWIGVLAQR
jgi:glycosyltransferase involved in cell wall biosynthesis